MSKQTDSDPAAVARRVKELATATVNFMPGPVTHHTLECLWPKHWTPAKVKTAIAFLNCAIDAAPLLADEVERLTAENRKPFMAAQFAQECHHGQSRKYTGAPYISHPTRVAARVMLLPEATADMVCAAWLHDVVEDCSVSHEELARRFGPSVTKLVVDLTNPSKWRPELNRANRKAMDREHLATVSRQAKLIKLIDRIDNLHEMADAPSDFRTVYVSETRLLAYVLRDASTGLCNEMLAAAAALGDKGAGKSTGREKT